MRRQYPDFQSTTPIGPLIDFNYDCTGTVSKFYSQLCALKFPVSVTLKATWCQDIVLTRVHKSPICARQGLIQSKIVHRAHWTRCRLAKPDPNIDQTCIRCHRAPATLLHLFWSCLSPAPFCMSVFATLPQVVASPTEPSPIAFFLAFSLQTLHCLPTSMTFFCL